MVVLKVSTGISRIPKRHATTDAATVLAATGILAITSHASKAVSVPVLAAVSGD